MLPGAGRSISQLHVAVLREREVLLKREDRMANTFHVSLYVEDLDAAVAAYRKILGIEPAKVRPGYAKFELADPPVIFSLTVGGEPGTLSHLGHLGPVTVETMDLLIGRKKLSSAGSGGRPSTAAMLHFCAEHGITADIELLPSSQVNRALERLARNDVRYRFVLEMSDLD